MSSIEVKMYGASWCNPCKQTKPQFFKAADDYDYASDHDISWDYLDVDSLPTETLIQEDIRSVPTIKVYIDGKTVGEIASRTAPNISAEVDRFIYVTLYQDGVE